MPFKAKKRKPKWHEWKPRSYFYRTYKDRPDEWVKLAILWHHMRNRGMIHHRRFGDPTRWAFSFGLFIDALLRDFKATAQLFLEIEEVDQAEVLKHLDLKRSNLSRPSPGSIRALHVARARYLARKAARELDPLTQD